MPRHADFHHPDQVKDLLHDLGHDHLRTRKRGAAVIVESGPKDDPVKHIRVRRDTVHLWCVDIANHRGKWEKTPLRGLLDDVVHLVAESFPWVLAELAPNPDRTSDLEH